MSHATSMRSEVIEQQEEIEGKFFPQDEVMVTKNNI
jgi:hypothetical protein